MAQFPFFATSQIATGRGHSKEIENDPSRHCPRLPPTILHRQLIRLLWPILHLKGLQSAFVAIKTIQILSRSR